MKHRFVLGIIALLLVGSFAVASAGPTSGVPYILDIGHTKIRAGENRTIVHHAVSDGAGDWHKLFFTPIGRPSLTRTVR